LKTTLVGSVVVFPIGIGAHKLCFLYIEKKTKEKHAIFQIHDRLCCIYGPYNNKYIICVKGIESKQS
jgi:hypothetical protein